MQQSNSYALKQLTLMTLKALLPLLFLIQVKSLSHHAFIKVKSLHFVSCHLIIILAFQFQSLSPYFLVKIAWFTLAVFIQVLQLT